MFGDCPVHCFEQENTPKVYKHPGFALHFVPQTSYFLLPSGLVHDTLPPSVHIHFMDVYDPSPAAHRCFSQNISPSMIFLHARDRSPTPKVSPRNDPKQRLDMIQSTLAKSRFRVRGLGVFTSNLTNDCLRKPTQIRETRKYPPHGFDCSWKTKACPANKS